VSSLGEESAPSAVAVDLGATSVRYAAGKLQGGRIGFEVVEQVPNEPVETEWGLVWRTETLSGICRRAEQRALAEGGTLGIDSWGVDHGFVGANGELLQPPACYRHALHQEVFEQMASLRAELYALTGTQYQPFNTIYQLVARARQRPELLSTGVRWLILPELMAHLLGAPAAHELTQASTTQLLGLDGKWSSRAFEVAGWPVPDAQPQPPGRIVGKTTGGAQIVRVGGHDTASAVCGIGPLAGHQAFLSIGTWSLLGVLLDRPLATSEAESANFTNERAVDGRVRFLANIPGFYVINRLHEELGISAPIPEWLSGADRLVSERIDLMRPELFAPESMLRAVRAQLRAEPEHESAWAGIALLSLVDTTCEQVELLSGVAGRDVTELRVAGGGSASEAFCRALADRSGRLVSAGPQEATLLGNLAVQFLGQGAFSGFDELGATVLRSVTLRTYEPSARVA